MHQPIMSPEDLSKLLDEEFPQLVSGGLHLRIDAIGPGVADVALQTTERHLRPGGTVSGPTLVALADVSAYLVILAHLGPVVSAVTTNLSINFLKRPTLGELLARARLLRLGKRLAVVEISILTVGDDEPCAHAVATYALPTRLVS